MKNLFYVTALFTLSLTSCLKVGQQETCFDGKLNNGESGIDCGGSCACPCDVPVMAPCSPTVNSINWGANSYTNVTCSTYTSGSNYVYRGQVSGSTYVEVTFPSIPTADAIYTSASYTSCPSLASTQCCVKAQMSFQNYWYTGSVFVLVDGSNIEIVLCSLSSQQHISGLTSKLIFP